MYKQLSPKDVIYNTDISDKINLAEERKFPECNDLFESIKKGLNIKGTGYNVYLIDEFTKEKLNSIINYIDGILNDNRVISDICCLVEDDSRNVKSILVPSGYGKKLSDYVDDIKKMYLTLSYKFYSDSEVGEKEEIIDEIQNKKNKLVTKMLEEAKNKGFQLKTAESGFNFIPLKNEEPMTEREYELLSEEDKTEILDNIKDLKKISKKVFEEFKVIEESELEKLKVYYRDFILSEAKGIKDKYSSEFKQIGKVMDYLSRICNEIEDALVENYSINYDNDENKIIGAISKYSVNVIVDNSSLHKAPVIYEDDPTLEKLIGSIRYENHSGTYVTDLSLIRAGAILKANGGCLILRLSNLLSNSLSYYYLKKILLSSKVNLNYSRGYMEMISLNGLNVDPIKVNLKVVLIGDYESYEFLYNYDEDFRNLFKLKGEYKPLLTANNENKQAIIKAILEYAAKNKLKKLTDLALKEVLKYLCRKAESREKYYFDNIEVWSLLTLSNEESRNEEKITEEHVRRVIYKEDLLEKSVYDNYKSKKILIDVDGKKIGQINGLSVIDLGYAALGKPMRITCNCCRGDGAVIDANKENSLSGSIHSKSISILRGLVNKVIGGYSKLPVDFHLCFEQLYGKLEGDSASVAETICMFSALSKIPIKQNIAVTGSINQFGEVQPIGGVNYKIEGYYKLCSMLQRNENCGVLIPDSNVDNLVLNPIVEEEISRGKFSIYSMSTIEDAVELLMDTNWENFMREVRNELRKYSGRGERGR